MGWSPAELDLFTELSPDRLPRKMRMIELGAQVIYSSEAHIRACAAKISPGTEITDEEFASHGGAFPAYAIAQKLGWSYACIDVSNEYGAIPLDLNFDAVPREHIGAYNLLTNFGTTEHIINQMNAHQMAHDLICDGGLIIHHLPAGGYFTHGFFSYTPAFFQALAAANGYEIVSLRWLCVPDDTKTVLGTFGPATEGLIPQETAARFSYVDAGLQVVFRKIGRAPFVPPFDGVVGQVADEKFRRRYSADPDMHRRAADNAPNRTSLS